MAEKFKKFEPSDEDIRDAFQIDDYGNFRIVIHGDKGEWANYQGIAKLEHGGRIYIAVSQYFKGVLPHECILEVTKTNITRSNE